MPCSAPLYLLVIAALQALGVTAHRTSLTALARLLTVLLLAQ
jgi:hypothetical protein